MNTEKIRRAIISSDVPVDLILGDGTVFGEKGNLQLTNRQIDPSTGSILIQAVFKNVRGVLRPGQYVKVTVQNR